MKRNFWRKILSVFLIGGLLLGTGSIALAAGNGVMAGGQGKMIRGGMGKGVDLAAKWETLLNKLTENSLITSEQAEALKNLAQQRVKEREEFRQEIKKMTPEERQQAREERRQLQDPFLSEAVEKGIITSEQAEAIMKAMHEERAAERQQEIKNKLDELVAAGTITQEQADKLLARMREEMEKREADMAKRLEITPEEWREYVKNREKPNIIRDLVAEGTITSEQASAIAKAIHPSKGNGMGQGKGMMGRGNAGNCPFASSQNQ